MVKKKKARGRALRNKFIWLLTATLLFSAIACSSDKKKTDDPAKTEAAETAAPTEASKTKVTTPNGEVSLCNYKGLKGEKLIYKVTEEDIQSEIDPLIGDYVTEKEVKRKSKQGDVVEMNVVATSDGQIIIDEEEETVQLKIGDAYLGESFDQKMTGVSAGDKPSFTIKYPNDFEEQNLAGLTVQYRVTVKSIIEEKTPELTDAFVKKNLGYASYNDMVTKIKADLEKANASQSETDLRENLLNQVVEGSKVEKHKDELYKSCKKSLEDMYNAMAEFGGETLEEYYKENDLTEAKRKEEILKAVNRSVVVEAIAAQEGFTELTDSEYKTYLKKYTEEQEYENEAALLNDYSEQDIKSWIMEDKVLDVIEKNATITEKEGTEDSQE